MTKQRLYQVVFEGTLTGEYEADEAMARFGRLFKLKPPRLEQLFSGKCFVLKKGIPESEALQYAIKIAEAGCESYIEAVPRAVDPMIAEHRKGSERRLRFRRGPRPGAIIPDRRLKIRRDDDSEAFEDLHIHNMEIPVGFSSYRKS